MKCKYKFKVKGRLRLGHQIPISCAGMEIATELKNGFVEHLLVTLPVPDEADWPTAIRDPEAGVKLQVNATSPRLSDVQLHLRKSQGFLALFGVDEIELEQPAMEWLPENEAERQALPLLRYEVSHDNDPTEMTPYIPFDLFARSILAATDSGPSDFALNFFRRGKLDVGKKNYIEAIYDFYFFLETLFAEGRFKKNQVKEKFCSSPMLRDAIAKVRDDPGPIIGHNQSTLEKVKEKYLKPSTEKCVEAIIDLRGYLHHHTAKRPGVWHPDEQSRFKPDALFLQQIAFNSAFAIAENHLSHPSVKEEYMSQIRKNGDTGNA